MIALRWIMIIGVAGCCIARAGAQEQRHPKHDYPTAARADFVIGCLMEHEFKHDKLDQCACKIDVIADHLSYDEFDQANTILGVQRNDLFRDTPTAKSIMTRFHGAQADANQACK